LTDIDLEKDEKLLALDLLWSDPAGKEQESGIIETGFGPNFERGDKVIIFGRTALNLFMKKTNCTHILRAHQPQSQGIQFSKNLRVITVFSSSHYCGQYNSAAIVFVNNGEVNVAIARHKTMDNIDSVKSITTNNIFQ